MAETIKDIDSFLDEPIKDVDAFLDDAPEISDIDAFLGEGPSLADKAIDLPKQAGIGVLKAAKNIGETIKDLIPDPDIPESARPTPFEAIDVDAIEKANPAQSIVGEFTREGTRFLAGFIPASKALSSLGMAKGFVQAMTAGAIADFSVFDPMEKRLSDLVQSVPALQNPVTEYLSVDEDDSKIEGRMKNVLEGMGLGFMIEGVLKTLRGIKGYRTARKAVTEPAIKETSEAVEPKLADSVIDLSTDVAQAKKKTSPTIAREFAEEATEPTLKVEAHEDIISAIESKLKGERNPSERITTQGARILEELSFDEISTEHLDGVLKKYGMTPKQLADELLASRTMAGRTLNRWSQLARKVGRYLDEKEPGAGKLMDTLANKELDSYVFDYFARGVRWIENKRRGILVTQLGTAVRNTISQAGRMTLSAFDEAMQTAILGVKNPQDMTKLIAGDLNALHAIRGSFARGKNLIKSVVSGRKIRDTALDELLESEGAAHAKARLFNQPVHEVTGIKKGLIHYLNVFNRTQEYFFRKLAFEAKLRQKLVQKGLQSLDDIDPKDIPDDLYDEAVDYALEMSFAASAKSKTAKSFIQSWSDIGLTTVNPFPRFAFANALPFVWQHSPLGFLDALRHTKVGAKSLQKLGLKGLADADPETFAKSASRATLGTMLLMSAWHIRQSANAGDKWYEMRVGDDEVIDVRSYAPLSTFLFVAEAIKDKINGTNKIKTADYAQMMVGLNRISGSGLVVVDLMRAEKPETSEKIMATFAGQYMGSYGVPFRTVKDIVAEFSTDEAIVRNTRENPVWAPFVNSIPFLSQNLPPATTPFREGIDFEGNLHPIRADEVTFQLLGAPGAPELGTSARQVFGLTGRKKNVLEEQVTALDIRSARLFARSGDPKANRLINGYSGYLNEKLVWPVLQSDMYKNMERPMKRKVLRELLTDTKRQAIKMFQANHLDLALQLKEERMDEDVLEIIGLQKGFLKREQ